MAHKLAPTLAVVAIATLCSACGAKTPPPADDFGSSRETPNTTAAEVEAPAPDKSGELNEAQEEQMMIALKRGGEKAAQCVGVVPDAVRGEGSVDVIFDGQKGRVVDATPGAPFAGTPVEACIRRSFVGEIVLPFDGPPKSVPYSVKLPEKVEEKAADKKAPKK